MTSKLTRERIELIANFHRAMTLPPSHAEIEELARMALAAMEIEPVAYISKSDFDAGYPHILARRDFNKACTMPVYAAQPAPVVPEEKPIPNTLSMYAVDAVAAIAEVKGWNACRAAMLQELKKSAGTEATCRSNENVQAVEVQSLTSINPAPDLVSLRKKAESIIGNYPGIPDGSEHCPCCGKKLRRTCSVEGCGGKHVAHGLCQKHYDMQRWEDPEQVERFREAGRRYRGKKKSTVATPQEPKP